MDLGDAEFTVTAKAYQGYVFCFQAVEQDKVGLDVAVPDAFEIARQGMIPIFCGQC